MATAVIGARLVGVGSGYQEDHPLPGRGDDALASVRRRLRRKTPIHSIGVEGSPASEGNGCSFLGLREVARRTVISLALEWAGRGEPPGLPGIGSHRHQA